VYSPYQSTEQLIISVQASLSTKKSERPLLLAAILARRGFEANVKSSGSDLNRIQSLHSLNSIFSSAQPDTESHIQRIASSIYLSSSSEVNLVSEGITQNRICSEYSELYCSMDFKPVENKSVPSKALTLKIFRMKKFNSTSTLFVDRTIIDCDILESLQ
jgi:hypothetical protein